MVLLFNMFIKYTHDTYVVRNKNGNVGIMVEIVLFIAIYTYGNLLETEKVIQK